MVLHNSFKIQGWILLFYFRGVVGLYFTQESYVFSPADSVIGQVIALPSITSPPECHQSSVGYRIRTVSDVAISLQVDQRGWILASSTYKGKGDFYFNVSAECGSGTKRERADVTVNVMNGGTCELQNLSSANNSKLRSITKDLCFQKQIFNLYIEERKRNGVVGYLSKCVQNISGNGVQRFYAIASDIFLIDNVTSEIRLLRDLDREQDTDMIKLDVKCDINFMKKDINYVNEGMINVHVADVNDNPPMFHNTLTQQINAGKLKEVEEVIVDKDTQDFSKHEIKVLEEVNITRPENEKNDIDHKCLVQVRDPAMLLMSDNPNNAANLTIIIPSEKSRVPVRESPDIFYATISRMASRLAKMLLVQVTWTKCLVTRVVGSVPETGNVVGDPGTKGGIPGSFPLASLT